MSKKADKVQAYINSPEYQYARGWEDCLAHSSALLDAKFEEWTKDIPAGKIIPASLMMLKDAKTIIQTGLNPWEAR